MLKDLARKIHRWFLEKKHNGIIQDAFAESESNNKANKRIIMFESPSYGNLGDHAIAAAEKEFIQDKFPTYDYIEITHLDYQYSKDFILEKVRDEDLILICGGGFLGSMWANAHNHVIDIVKSFPNNKMIQFPQTAFFEDNEKGRRVFKEFNQVLSNKDDLDFFVRERNSYDFLKANMDKLNTYLAPDIAMYLEESQALDRSGVLFCLRQDKEKVNNHHVIDPLEKLFDEKQIAYRFTDTVIDKKLNYRTRDPYLAMKANEFAESELVVTDRLHGMIFALVTGTPCIALDNKSKKVSGVYKWIKDNNKYIYLLDQEEANNISSEALGKIALDLIKQGGHIYKNDAANKALEPLAAQIKKALD